MEKLDSCWPPIRQSDLLIPSAGCRTEAAVGGGGPQAGLAASLGWVLLADGCCSLNGSAAAVAAAADVAVVVVAAAEAASLAAGGRRGEGIRWAAASSAEVQQACRSGAAARACHCPIQVSTSRSQIGFSLQPGDTTFSIMDDGSGDKGRGGYKPVSPESWR